MSLVPDTLLDNHLATPTLRDAGAEVLSLALLDARNHSLHVAKRIYQSLAACAERARAERARDALLLRLERHGSQLATWVQVPWEFRPAALPKTWEALQTALLASSEGMQERLMDAAPDSESLAAFRAALELEDRLGQSLIRIANQWANAWAESAGSRAEDAAQVWGTDWPAPHAHAARQPLWMPARPWTLGQSARLYARLSAEAFAWHDELHHDSVRVNEFDIDAQPVSWGQFVEFVDDAGYDREELWSAAGWLWVHQNGRRAPWAVEQLGVASGAVLQRSFGRLTRRAGAHACMHVSYFEAEAFARWADRRLPTEHEWEIAATVGAGQGFRWGDVMEWTLDRYRAGLPRAGEFAARPDFSNGTGSLQSVRGASFAARPRNKLACARYFAEPERDDAFIGFRTCSL